MSGKMQHTHEKSDRRGESERENAKKRALARMDESRALLQQRHEEISRTKMQHEKTARALGDDVASAPSGQHLRHQKATCECTGLAVDQSFTLETQADVDAFPSDYAIINGSVTIGGASVQDPIVNLNALANVCEITGVLVVENTDLVSLGGLENLQRVGGALTVAQNDLLQSIDELRSLRRVGDDFLILQNPALEKIAKLHRLEYIGGSFGVVDNSKLEQITGLNNCKVGLCVGRSLEIFDNELLAIIDGFNGLHSAQRVAIFQNDSLVSLRGFERLEFVFDAIFVGVNNLLQTCVAFRHVKFVDELSITSCPALQTLSAFQHIAVTRDLLLSDLQALETLDAFQKLQVVREDLRLLETGLRSVDAFASLTHVLRDLTIDDNALLDNIDGLIGLKAVGQEINISDNAVLASLAGLSRLQESAQVGDRVEVQRNDTLTDFCGLQPLAQSNPSGEPSFSVDDNGPQNDNMSKEEIADLEPCSARDFFDRTLNRWLAAEQIAVSVACSLAHSMSKRNVQKWRCAGKLTCIQAILLLAALDRCVLAGADQLPPCGLPLSLSAECCATQLSGSERFAFLTAHCSKKCRCKKSHHCCCK